MSGSKRGLGDDELAVWKSVTRSIAPLRREARPEGAAVAEPATKPSLRPKPSSVRPTPVAAKPPPSKPAPSLAPLDRRTRQRLARGTEPIDARLDLHGRTQAEAHSALLAFLRRAQSRGAKNVLVITGKGARDFGSGTGVLRRQLPQWLALPDFRELVLAFEQAHVAHGGEGAFYLRLRKAK